MPLSRTWALLGGTGAADSTVPLTSMHKTGLKSSQRAGVPDSAEAVAAAGEGEAVPKA